MCGRPCVVGCGCLGGCLRHGEGIWALEKLGERHLGGWCGSGARRHGGRHVEGVGGDDWMMGCETRSCRRHARHEALKHMPVNRFMRNCDDTMKHTPCKYGVATRSSMSIANERREMPARHARRFLIFNSMERLSVCVCQENRQRQKQHTAHKHEPTGPTHNDPKSCAVAFTFFALGALLESAGRLSEGDVRPTTRSILGGVSASPVS